MTCHHDIRVLAIDLGKKNSVWCVYQPHTKESYGTLATSRQEMHDLLVEHAPDRVVIEVGNAAGWISDLALDLGFDVQVANTNGEAWKWRNVKAKTDRRDALKLAQLSAMDQLPTVHMPKKNTRDWRALIQYRQSVVARRTRVKNSIRAILDRQEIRHPASKSGWTQKATRVLHELAAGDQTWQFMLRAEMEQLLVFEQQIRIIEDELAVLARADDRVALLKSVPAVGDRLAETIVAVIDDPHRFKRGRDVGCYAGLTPRVYQSGAMNRQGRISGQGNKLLRALLVQVAWLGVSRFKVPWMVALFDRVSRDMKTRRKVAIVAVARHLLVRCWAMLRDNTAWREPTVTPVAAS